MKRFYAKVIQWGLFPEKASACFMLENKKVKFVGM